MTTPAWAPGKLTAPGALVVPRTTPPAPSQVIPNASFESGLADWTTDAGWSSSGASAYLGAFFARYTGAGTAGMSETASRPVTPGQSITLSAYYRTDGEGETAGAYAVLLWYDELGNPLPASNGDIGYRTDNEWRKIAVTASAPGGARFVRAGVAAFIGLGGGHVDVDALSWNYSPSSVRTVQYKAVQGATGTTGTSEPAWPLTIGATVSDNDVTWEAVQASRVVMQARPVLRSGATEPAWPTQHGAFVSDGTISWEAVDLRVTDPNCPHSKVVVIAKSKVYAGAGDIVRYSATLNARDWTSIEDAGYIGTGLMQNGANEVTVLNLYRGNLIVMNATTFQQWNIDADPALMDMLDAMEGIGSMWHLAAQPVANDLFYLSTLGVRTIGLSGASNNLRSGDVGLPVDPLVQELVREARASGEQPLGMYYPAAGQYWLIINRIARSLNNGASATELCPEISVGDRYAEIMVYTLNQIGQVGAWTRYVYPFALEYAAQNGDDLFVRDGNTVFRLSELIGATDNFVDLFLSSLFTEEGEPLEAEDVPGISLVTEESKVSDPEIGLTTGGVPFNAVIWWPHLDMGSPGQDKTMESFDLVGYGSARIEIGYNQRDPLALTEPYAVTEDTLDGNPVPLTVTAPSLSIRLTYPGWKPDDSTTFGQRFWEFNTIGINITK